MAKKYTSGRKSWEEAAEEILEERKEVWQKLADYDTGTVNKVQLAGIYMPMSTIDAGDLAKHLRWGYVKEIHEEDSWYYSYEKAVAYLLPRGLLNRYSIVFPVVTFLEEYSSVVIGVHIPTEENVAYQEPFQKTTLSLETGIANIYYDGAGLMAIDPLPGRTIDEVIAHLKLPITIDIVIEAVEEEYESRLMVLSEIHDSLMQKVRRKNKI